VFRNLLKAKGKAGAHPDLYSGGDTSSPIVAEYPGSLLRIYKRQFNGLPWPDWQMILLPKRKLVYNPIAKSGSSSLRAAILALSDVSDELKGLPMDTHTTGLQLGDLPRGEALEILRNREYVKFAVMRDPFDRLVSAYLEKFVVNRAHPSNQFHTRNVIATVIGERSPAPKDFERSISFANFVDYVVTQSPESLDPHWCPQYLYLRSAVHHVFRLEKLHEVATLLGDGFPILNQNVTRKARSPVHEAYRLTPGELPHTDIATESFYNSGLRRQVETYFALDFTLREADCR
jgi:hypothetical protein